MKHILFFLLVTIMASQWAVGQPYTNSVPSGDTWYQIGTRGNRLVKIYATGDFAVHEMVVYIVSGNYNTAEFTIVSEYNYNHKQIKLEWGYVGSGANRYLVLKSTPTPNATYANGFTITDVSDPTTDFNLTPVSDVSSIVPISPSNVVYNSEHLQRVGIGTLEPMSKLHVKGATIFEDPIRFHNGTANKGLVWGNDSWANYYSRIDDYGGQLRIMTDDKLLFTDINSGDGAPTSTAVFINTNDKALGVNTDLIPSGYRLAVAGKAIMEEIKVEAAPWPDYVFSEGYQLPDLGATADFIKANKHLPGIPSATEVAEQGILLGEMNAKLLEKIEELTLHLIELERQNKKLNERLTNLENKKQ
ncbi:prefoldin domain-containing protein [Marinoscillum luteum]|uniref:Peptidase S74 domain-containing protein n=1 Tax=Marinoscillum luteum TaxID=861051 RepID=A0ABW7NEJ5_9BACT